MRVDAHCRFLIRLDRRSVVISSDRVYSVEPLDYPPQHVVYVAEVSTILIIYCTILIYLVVIISYRYLPNIYSTLSTLLSYYFLQVMGPGPLSY